MITSEPEIGYCTNVHGGRSIAEVKENLERYSLPVKQRCSPDQPFGIGLWLSASAVHELHCNDTLKAFKQWLDQHSLVPFTINGFPYGDFHQEIVKHDVYQPTWAEYARIHYTLNLAFIQSQLLPAGSVATISTLPIGWPGDNDEHTKQAAAIQLRMCARELNELYRKEGQDFCLCIEPEPGCILDTADDVVNFFESYLLTGDPIFDPIIRRHLGVCHDVCHSAVMFEAQGTAIQRYQAAGIRVGKVQVSSAIELQFGHSAEQDRQLLAQLERLKSEKRYLHQTSIRRGLAESKKTGASDSRSVKLYEDLAVAVEENVSGETTEPATWRIHFHVPIHCETIGPLQTTQREINECLDALTAQPVEYPTNHFEVETYAWNVFPQDWDMPDLAAGIGLEVNWFQRLIGGQTPD